MAQILSLLIKQIVQTYLENIDLFYIGFLVVFLLVSGDFSLFLTLIRKHKAPSVVRPEIDMTLNASRSWNCSDVCEIRLSNQTSPAILGSAMFFYSWICRSTRIRTMLFVFFSFFSFWHLWAAVVALRETVIYFLGRLRFRRFRHCMSCGLEIVFAEHFLDSGLTQLEAVTWNALGVESY